MDGIRALVQEIQVAERQLLAQRQEQLLTSTRLTWVITLGGSALLLLLIAGAAVMTSRDYRARETQIWLRTGQAELAQRIQGEQRLEALGDNVLDFLAEYLDCAGRAPSTSPKPTAGSAAFAGYALPRGPRTATCCARATACSARPPRRTARCTSRTCRRAICRSPRASAAARRASCWWRRPPSTASSRRSSSSASFVACSAADQELLARVSEALGVAVRASKDRTRLEELLEETQRQAEELQTQQEELRVTNEELEEQSRALQGIAGAARRRSRPSSSRPTRSSRSRRSCSEQQKDELSQRAGRADARRPPSSSAPTSTRASSWPT